jgi:outer membrane lipase/esterase
MKQIDLAAAFLGAAVLITPVASRATEFNQFIGFGDSTLDSGYFRYNTTGNPTTDQAIAAAVAQGAKGGYAGPGTMDSILLAGRFGLNAEPIGNGGSNYANGGAHTLVDAPGHVSTVQQIDNYLTSVHGAANPRGLYIVSTGNNDWIYTLMQGPSWNAANPDYLIGLADPFASKVAMLQAAGARTVVVPNSYTYAVLAGPGGEIPAALIPEYTRIVAFNSAMWSSLARSGVNFIPADMDSVFKYVVHNPGRFGFTAESVLSNNAPSKVSALLTTAAMLTPEQERTYLFIDGAHLTTAGQQIEADYMSSLITAPNLVSLVAEGAVENGFSRTSSLQHQIESPQRGHAPGSIDTWGNAGASTLRLRNDAGYPTMSGTFFGGSVGADYQTRSGMILGAAITAGGQNQHFSSGGHCDQADEALSFYVTGKTGCYWGDALATVGLQQYRIARQVPLGLFTDQNRADTDGRTIAFALRGGREFGIGAIVTGPVLGVNLQQVRFNGFTEAGAAGVTALWFGAQSRDAYVGQLGWRAAVDAGDVRFSADAEWNHDWNGGTRKVTAALTSSDTAPYTVAAAPVSKDWATIVIGATYRVTSRASLRVNASAMFGNPRVTSYGGGASLSMGF